jgi:general secretion pathway protein D
MSVLIPISTALSVMYAAPPVTDSTGQVDGIRCERLPLSSTISLDAEGLDLQSFARIISCVTGERFLFNSDLTAEVTILTPTKISVREAKDAFVQALSAVGLAMLKVGKFTRIVPKSRAAARTRIYRERHQDEWQTQFIAVPAGRMRDAQTLATLLISPAANVGAHLPSSTLIVTSTVHQIRRLRTMILHLGMNQPERSIALSILPTHVSPAQLDGLLRRVAVHLELPVETGITARGGQLFIVGGRADVVRMRRILARIQKISPGEIQQFIINVNDGDMSSISRILN